MKFIKYLSLTSLLVLILGFNSSSVLAAPTDTTSGGGAAAAQSDACAGLGQLDSTDSCATGQNDTVSNISGFIVGLIAKIVGVIAVIMILVSGFRFVTAAGDSNAVSSARTTLIYAIVGLLIAVLAQFIASNVLNTAAQINNKSTATPSTNANSVQGAAN